MLPLPEMLPFHAGVQLTPDCCCCHLLKVLSPSSLQRLCFHFHWGHLPDRVTGRVSGPQCLDSSFSRHLPDSCSLPRSIILFNTLSQLANRLLPSKHASPCPHWRPTVLQPLKASWLNLSMSCQTVWLPAPQLQQQLMLVLRHQVFQLCLLPVPVSLRLLDISDIFTRLFVIVCLSQCPGLPLVCLSQGPGLPLPQCLWVFFDFFKMNLAFKWSLYAVGVQLHV